MTRRIRANGPALESLVGQADRHLMATQAALAAALRQIDRTDPLAEAVEQALARAAALECRLVLIANELTMRP